MNGSITSSSRAEAERLCKSLQCWTRISDFQAELAQIWASRSREEVHEYRLGRGVWKRVRDEVVPVSDHLRFWGLRDGRIRFSMSDQIPDCFIWLEGEAQAVGVEVTVAQGRERFHLAKELNKATDLAPGFLGISDDAPQSQFDEAVKRGRVAYSTAQALAVVRNGLARCLSRKNETKYAGYHLLIQAPLHSLPAERWRQIESDFKELARDLPFAKIFAIGSGGSSPLGFQIK